MIKIKWTNEARDGYNFWLKTNNEKIIRKIGALVEDILQHSFTGIGKPEPLKDDFSGFWSRRIDQEHRLVYTITNEELIIIQCRFHY